MSGPKSGTFTKKTYYRPTLTPKSISEVDALLRRKVPDPENTSETRDGSDSIDIPILLIEGYEGDPNLIRQTDPTPARQLEPFSILKGGGWIEVQFTREQNVGSRETLLLLDLRGRGHGERGLLESIGRNPAVSEAAPRVILVSSMDQFRGWRGINATQCWQLRGSPSPTDVAVALRSFLHLCGILTKQSPGESPAQGKTDNHALIGKPVKD